MVKPTVWLVTLFAIFVPSLNDAPSSFALQASQTQHSIAGTSLRRFAKIDEHVYKGGEPKTDADYEFLRSLGIKYIVDLKFFPILPSVEKRKANRYGITVIPVTLNGSPIAPSEKHINQALCALHDPHLHPIYLHCDIGRDRTSLVATLYEMYFKGLPPREAWAEMKRFGFKDSWTLYGLKRYLRKYANEAQVGKGAPNCTAVR